ncbi:MAG: helix-turn-helix domain-containing protein [Desulfurococcaceae archaeon]
METESLNNIYDIRVLMKRNIILTQPLWKTLSAVIQLKEATAEDVSRITGRPRTVESKYLSELNRIGLVARRRVSRRVYYIEAITAVKKALEELGSNVSVERLAHYINLPADIVKIVLDSLTKTE